MAEENNFIYELKNSLMTPSELNFYKGIKSVLSEEYILQPQINLSTIINRTDNSRFANELFRNIDFGIFDKQYKPIILIEINDQSHTEKQRKERDIKVKNICEEVGIPLVILWTSYGVNKEYIKKRIDTAIEQSKNPVRIKHSKDKEEKTTDNLSGFQQEPQRNEQKQNSGGCYIATSVYGSYDYPSVWVLRKYRDYSLKKSIWGRVFIKIYYALSPTLVKLFGSKKWFKDFFRKKLDNFVITLKEKGYKDTNYYD